MAFLLGRTSINEINAEIKRNTKPVKNYLPWQLAKHNNEKPKVVRVKQVDHLPTIL